MTNKMFGVESPDSVEELFEAARKGGAAESSYEVIKDFIEQERKRVLLDIGNAEDSAALFKLSGVTSLLLRLESRLTSQIEDGKEAREKITERSK